MQVVAKADRLGALQQLDAIEDAAAHVARALERIQAVAGDQDRLLAGREHARDARVFVVAEEAAPDGRLRDERRVQVDERLVGSAGLWARGRRLVARIDEGLVDLADREVEMTHRAVAQQGRPVGDRAGLRVDHARRRLRAGRSGAQAQRACDPDRRAHDALAHHQHGDGGAADDVGVWRPAPLGRRAKRVVADEMRQVGDDPLLGNADQHDRLAVRHQFRADDRAFEVEPHHDVDRLARIADRVDLLRVQVRIADQRLAAIRRRHGRIGLHRSEAVGAGHDLGRGEPREELPEVRGLRRRRGRSEQRDDHEGARHDRQERRTGAGDGQIGLPGFLWFVGLLQQTAGPVCLRSRCITSRRPDDARVAVNARPRDPVGQHAPAGRHRQRDRARIAEALRGARRDDGAPRRGCHRRSLPRHAGGRAPPCR